MGFFKCITGSFHKIDQINPLSSIQPIHILLIMN